MSYPEPKYFGSGEVTAWFRPADAAPELPRPGGYRARARPAVSASAHVTGRIEGGIIEEPTSDRAAIDQTVVTVR
jgi:hypothetical protein